MLDGRLDSCILLFDSLLLFGPMLSMKGLTLDAEPILQPWDFEHVDL